MTEAVILFGSLRVEEFTTALCRKNADGSLKEVEMKPLITFSLLVVIMIIACSQTTKISTPSETPNEHGDTLPILTIETYQPGESISFTIDDRIYICEDELPYRIVQITEPRDRKLNLEHTCLGFAGSGVDQFCENGEVKSVEVVFCTDVMFCEEESINQTFNWDQLEFVQVSEDCAGTTIFREIQEQAPEGIYQVHTLKWKNEQATPVVIKEFRISPGSIELEKALKADDITQAVMNFLEHWTQSPFQDLHIDLIEDTPQRTKASVRVKLPSRSGSDWVTKVALFECRKHEGGFICDRYSTFRRPEEAPITISAAPSGFEYPSEGQTLNYGDSYLFKVSPIEDAEGYLWGFFQNGVMVWENLRDEGHLSSNEYGIHPNSKAHEIIQPGVLQIVVRGSINGQWTESISVNVYLR
jgi:hypothetical protein